MQNVPVELLRVLQKSEMASIRLDEQRGAGRPVRHRARLVVIDHFIVIGIDDPGRHSNFCKIRFRPVRLRIPHVGDLREERLIIVRRRR